MKPDIQMTASDLHASLLCNDRIQRKEKKSRSPSLICELASTFINLKTLGMLLRVQIILRKGIAIFTYWMVVDMMRDYIDEALSLCVH